MFFRKHYGNPPMPEAVQDRQMRIGYWTGGVCFGLLLLIWLSLEISKFLH